MIPMDQQSIDDTKIYLLKLVSVVFLALAVLASVVCGQEFVIAPEKKLNPQRIHFVVDVSGSLRTNLGEVLRAVTTLAPPGSDQAMIKVTVFSGSYETWDRGVEGWVEVPGPEDMKAAQKLIDETFHGDTQPLAAMLAAMQEPKVPKEWPKGKKAPGDIWVVVVTDGLFTTLSTIHLGAHVASSKHPVTFFHVGSRGGMETLEHLGKQGGGLIAKPKETK